MASLGMAFAAPVAVSGRVFQATATTKSTGGSAEEKGLFDWILSGLQKEDQLVETDPILKKVEGKNNGSGTGTTGTTRRKSPNSVSVPSNKKTNGSGGVFGGLFAKK
ncbi:uncharacterized protein LOC110022084 [Phalaenopsis equestris]|uniref:uncharacterized protein LOC110022084 n=1 Tax=Phalaenopsis equestris TaxID=78828 RepID=UPI0009E393C6|nr:uncharacterized protein LOC110022084 [Phalaenopsis equestris]